VGGGSKGAPATIRKALKGNEAHGRTEPWSRRKRRGRATDPTTEQRLEADATVLLLHESHPGNGMKGVQIRRRHANGKRATTAVTRNGCRRGISFEGSESRCEELATAPSPPSPAGSGPSEHKRSEPHDRQRDATSPRTSRRRKPSKWCKTTWTEHDFRSGTPGAEARRARRAGVDAWWSCRWRGERCAIRSAGRVTQMNPTREGRLRPGREAWCSEEGPRPGGSAPHSLRIERARSARHLEGRTGNGQLPRRSRGSPNDSQRVLRG